MKTDLAYINDTIEAEVEAEYSGQKPYRNTTPGKSVRMFGFDMPDEVTKLIQDADIIAKRSHVITQYRKNASELRVKLMAADIKPLAIIPHKAWTQICEDADLYRMIPDQQSTISLDQVNRVRELRHKGSGWCRTFGWFVGLVTAVAVIYTASCAGMWTSDFSWQVSIAITALVSGSLSAGIATFVALEKYNIKRNIAQYLKNKTWSQILADLSTSRLLVYGQIQARVQLPVPPIDVAQIVLKVHNANLKLRVAAEPDAIQIDGGLSKMFDTAINDLFAQEAAVRRDPILYITNGKDEYGHIIERDDYAVAIIAQYGDFPIEKEVVDKLIAQRTVL